jgi:anti-sigma factor RsiW
VNCREAHNLIHAYCDGELDLTHSLEVESHLSTCQECSRERQNLQVLKTALKDPALYFKAPASLRRQVLSQTRRVEPRARVWSWNWFAPLAVATAATCLVLFLAGNFAGPSSQERLAQEITASHIRSMMAGHISDVASSDQHTVKPWFDGKVDFAPPVKDLARQGFPLSGGRLDYIDGHPAAALVYLRQKHIINLFIWPTNAANAAPGAPITRNGYHLFHWVASGMSFWAASDLNEKELGEFVDLFQRD